MTGRARLSGLNALLRRLNPEAALSGALAGAGQEVARQARAELRAQGAEDALADSLTVQVCPPRVHISSDHPAARPSEFGTLRQSPKPWLQPAFAAARDGVRGRLRQALKMHLTQRQRKNP